MLKVHDLWGGYGKTSVIRHLSFTAKAGEITAILGPNGCGKSTLLKTIGGILPLQAGEVFHQDTPLSSLSPQKRAQTVCYLAQNRQPPDLTVRQLVLHGRFPYLHYPRRYRWQDRQMVQRVLEDLQLLPLADRPLRQLSGGQQQTAYVAMALAQNTPVVLLDEPTTYLDVSHQWQILSLAQSLAKQGKIVVMVLHDLSHALETAHHVVVMEEGTVIAQGTPEEIYANRSLQNVFHVAVHRVETQGGWHYFCANP